MKRDFRQIRCRSTIKTLVGALCLIISLLAGGCGKIPEYDDTLYGNFDALAEIIDTRYCFFREKDIDWAEVTARYRAQIKPEMSQLELFMLCGRMLDELRDGHVNLISHFNTTYYRKWWTDYPQDFNLRTLQQYYLGFDYFQTSGISYKILEEGIGYMYFPSFSTQVGELNLDYVLAVLYNCDVLILDIRNNGGGLLTNIDTFVGRFIDHEVCGGYILHKNGPGHSDFSEPYEIRYRPAESGRICWLGKPVLLLTNRSCYSAANDFVAVMKSLPQVTVIGARTGGGGGLPFSSELPSGWGVRFSACPILAPDGSDTETGIDPTDGYECHSPERDLARGVDAILNRALKEARKVIDDKNAVKK